MNEIIICMGSSCFSRGNNKSLELIRTYLKQEGLDTRIRFAGSLCEGVCRSGPLITIDGVAYRGVSPAAVLDILSAHRDDTTSVIAGVSHDEC